MSNQQRRFEEDYEIFTGLPEQQKIDIGDAFHFMINAVLTALRIRPPVELPPSSELSDSVNPQAKP